MQIKDHEDYYVALRKMKQMLQQPYAAGSEREKDVDQLIAEIKEYEKHTKITSDFFCPSCDYPYNLCHINKETEQVNLICSGCGASAHILKGVIYTTRQVSK